MKSLIRRAEAPRKLQERQKKHSNGPGNLSSAKLWKRFRRSSARKETIEALMEMQGAYCAYCEDQILDGNRHIDHFYPKSLYQEKIFDWDNLFLSCGNDHSTHCGHGKGDKDPINVIKPDRDNPVDYFAYNAGGEVIAREDISQEMQERAKNTISLLVLNDPLLRDKRSRRYENLLKNIKEQWLSSSEVDYRQQFSALADKVRGHAFGEFLFYLIQERLKN